jgi:HSP20 family protein
MNNDQFFENLANGKASAADDNGDVVQATPASENEMGNYEAEVAVEHEGDGQFEVELAKAGTSAVASRSIKARAVAENESEDDGTEGQLTVDVYQTADDIVVESAIAGVKPEDIDVNVTSDSISIRGARHHEQEVRESDYLYQECYWGRFARSIILPQEIDPENAEVSFKNGILTVRLPKVNKRKTRKLKVRID